MMRDTGDTVDIEDRDLYDFANKVMPCKCPRCTAVVSAASENTNRHVDDS